MATCSAISECGSIYASVECLAAVVQGENYYYEIQLTNADGTPLDITLYDAIVMKLYGEAVDISYESLYYGYWGWPFPLNSEIENELYVLQTTEVPSGTTVPIIVNEGMIAFDLDYELTRYFNTGKLYAEIKLKQQNSGTGGFLEQPVYTIITCLKIGNVKGSKTRDFFF
jgi:hypothetical protein